VLLARPVRRIEVAGESMLPALRPGDRLLVVQNMRMRVGDVVALRDPRRPRRTLVKRVAALPGGAVTVAGEVLRAGDGYVVLGDNLHASTDSRSFGAVPRRLLLGRCVHRYWPEAARVDGP
jgi:nickel-type superoxide dismutase maturation protease